MERLKTFWLKVVWQVRKIVFATVDFLIPKRADYWIFPVYFIGDGSFVDNTLAVFEAVKKDSSIRKIILTRKRSVSVDGENVTILPMRSYQAAYFLLRARVIFVQHSLWLDFAQSKCQITSIHGRTIVNLWHGIPIKDISHQNTGIHTRRGLAEMAYYKVITSSETDTSNMRKAFRETPHNAFWETGLPRNDFLLCPEKNLPEPLKKMLIDLDNILSGRQLILYAPTYRETDLGGKYYEFSDNDLLTIKNICLRNNCLFGVRYHIYRRPEVYSRLIEKDFVIDLSESVVEDVRMIMRRTNLLITDYSSIVADAIYLDKPYISFAYDLENYENVQRGFFYPYEEIFPEVCRNSEVLFEQIENHLIDTRRLRPDQKDIPSLKALLYRHSDSSNASRVVEHIKTGLSV